MIWREINKVYQITMSNNYIPFYYENNKLYIITGWSIGTAMLNADPQLVTNKAEGLELVSYGN